MDMKDFERSGYTIEQILNQFIKNY